MSKIFKEIIREKYLEEIRPFYHSQYIKILTGIRRCGKSTILLQIRNELLNLNIDVEQIISIDLEKDPYVNIKNVKQLLNVIRKKIINKNKYYIFIDEIQRINKFEIALAAIRATYNCSLFVTGSNSKLLHGKLQDRLTGRAREYEILPFTFSEFIEFKKVNQLVVKDLYLEFQEYITWGGMPQLFEETNAENKIKYLNNLYDSIIQKDVFDNHSRIDKELFIKLSNYIISTSGKPFSALSIAKYLKKTMDIKNPKTFSKTINSYANLLVECYFLKECFPLETGTKRSLLGTRKFYNIDNGIRSAIRDLQKVDASFALENAIYLELIYQGYKVYYGKHNQYEIDFIAIKNKKQYLIQVTQLLEDSINMERELKPFKYFRNNDNKFIVSLDPLDKSNDEIKHIKVIDFLMHEVEIK